MLKRAWYNQAHGCEIVPGFVFSCSYFIIYQNQTLFVCIVCRNRLEYSNLKMHIDKNSVSMLL